MPSKSNLLNQWGLLELLMEIRVNVIYRSKNVSQTAVSPKPAIALVKAHKSWEPGTNCTVWIQIRWLENVLSKWLGYKRVLGSPAGFCFFGEADLVSESLCSLADRRVTLSFYCSLWQGRAKWIQSFFRDSLKIFELFGFLFKELPYRTECFNLRGNF